MARTAAGVVEELTADEQAMLDADRDAPAAPEPELDEQAQSDAAPEPAADSVEDAPADERRAVPYEALNRERERAKAFAAERDEARERARAADERARVLEERTNLILQQVAQQRQQHQPPQPQGQQQPAQPELPPIETDPVGHILGQLKQRDQVIAALVHAVSGQNRQVEASRGEQELRVRAEAAEHEFRQTTPDYDNAVGFLVNQRRSELAAAGWTDPAEIQAMIGREVTAHIAESVRRGRNPAAVAYELAKVRGYQPPAPNAGNGTAPQNGAAAQQIETIERGQQQARSPGQLPGQRPAVIDARRVASMSPAEFEKFLKGAESDPDKMRAVFGA